MLSKVWCTLIENVSAATIENSTEVPEKWKIKLLYDPAIPCLVLYSKEVK